MSENVTIKWWKMPDGSSCGAVGEEADSREAAVATFGTPMPDGAVEITEAEFAAILRAGLMADKAQHVIAIAQQAAAVEQLQQERAGRVAELVALGVTADTAEAMIPAAPSPPSDLPYQIPQGSAGFLRSAYYLSQESIDLILAPIEE